MRLRINYTWDAESRNWCFVVPSLGIIGGGETREQAVQAIEFTLESENEASTAPFSEVAHVRVTVEAG